MGLYTSIEDGAVLPACHTILEDLQREVIALSFTVAAAQFECASALVLAGDDLAAWDALDAAEARYGEGAGLMREMGGP
jgi:hypothetical protein